MPKIEEFDRSQEEHRETSQLERIRNDLNRRSFESNGDPRTNEIVSQRQRESERKTDQMLNPEGWERLHHGEVLSAADQTRLREAHEKHASKKGV